MGDEDAEEADISDDPEEEADATAYSRALAAASSEGIQVREAHLCNTPVLEQKQKEIEYKCPAGAKRVPWVDTLCIDGPSELPKKITAKHGVKLEIAFSELAAEAVREAYRRLRVMKVPASRPNDFYAEMLRSDAQMYKVRERAAEEQRRIRIVEARKKAQAAKKFQKKAKTVKSETRAQQKQQTLENIKDWREQRKKDKRNADESTLEDLLNKRKLSQKGQNATKEKDGKYRPPKKSAKQKAKDAKYGFGGRKRNRKSNDKDSVNDFSSSPWAKTRKGAGKGKGKGKGKGGGKAGGKGGKRKR